MASSNGRRQEISMRTPDLKYERIDGIHDPRVAEYRDVPDPELVRRRGLFVAEGRQVVRRLLEDRRHAMRSVLVSDAALASLAPVLAHGQGVRVFVCAADALRRLTGYNIHRGCLALAE